MTKRLTILGSTGSIGTQSLQVARQSGFEVLSLAAGSNIKLLEDQIREFKPKVAACFSSAAAADLRLRVKDTPTKILEGEEGVCEAAAFSDSDTVVSAIVGIAGLKPTLCAIESKKQIALANKETLVTAGDIVKAKAKEAGVDIIPVDSEHSAIFQCLQGEKNNKIHKIILTASGGPFFGKTRKELENITAADALKHPNWDMGAKITIDSATLMNKGLEVIEATHLFDVKASDIEVVVHRQSIVHSAIEMTDGAVIAQMGTPDMRLPIQYALTYPCRAGAYSRLDLIKAGHLDFYKPDTETFACLPLCIKAQEMGGIYPAAVNGANEESVKLFLKGEIGFLQIAELNRAAMENAAKLKDFTVEDVFAADKEARQYVRDHALKG